MDSVFRLLAVEAQAVPGAAPRLRCRFGQNPHYGPGPLAGGEIPPLTEDQPIRIALDAQAPRDNARAGKEPAPEIPGQRSTILTPTRLSGSMYVAAEPSPDRRVRIELTADDYPRAFVYEVPCDANRDSVLPEADLHSVRIVEPADNRAFKAPLDTLPVKFFAWTCRKIGSSMPASSAVKPIGS